MKFPKQFFKKTLKAVTKTSFKKYVAVGIIVLIITTIVRTASLYIGREWMDISLLILSPVISVVMFGVGFVMKYYIYDRWDMLKD